MARIDMANSINPIYYNSLEQMEIAIKSKYQERIIELEKANFELKNARSIGMAQQYQPGQIIPNINVNDWYYNENSMMYEQKCTTNPVKKDIKSLIAYYYNR